MSSGFLQRLVIRTRSVEYMPFLLSLFNFINGLVWFGYAFLGGIDVFIAVSQKPFYTQLSVIPD